MKGAKGWSSIGKKRRMKVFVAVVIVCSCTVDRGPGSCLAISSGFSSECVTAASLKHAKGRIQREDSRSVGVVFQTPRIPVGGGRRGRYCLLLSRYHSSL